MNNRTNCPKNEAGKVDQRPMGCIIGENITLIGGLIDPNYCMVNSDGDCIRHNPLMESEEKAA